MRYILIYREGSGEAAQWRYESFAAESNALAKACALIAKGCARDVRIEDDYRHIVKTDPDIRRQYEEARRHGSPW
jgi:hypothetical protein